MKLLHFLALASFLSISSYINCNAQNTESTNSTKKESVIKTKEEKKAARLAEKEALAAQEELLFNEGVQALKDSLFVIEADQIFFPKGVTKYLNASTNFIYMKKEKAVIQLALTNYASGQNGLGGFTVEGIPSKISLKTDKKGIVYYKFIDQGVAISATVNIQMLGNGNKATVTIYPNFNNNNITLRGNIVPYDKSVIFQGQTL